MKKLITLILIAAIVMANIPAVYAEEEYIDLDGVPYEEIILPPWFTTDSMPYVLEPYCIYLVYCNIFARLL